MSADGVAAPPTVPVCAGGDTGTAHASAVVALFNFSNAVILPWRPAIEPRRGVIISLAALIAGVVALVAAQALASLTLLLVSTIVGGMASGLGYRATLQEVNDLSSSENRSKAVSLYVIALYLGPSIPVLGVGFLVSYAGSLMANRDRCSQRSDSPAG